VAAWKQLHPDDAVKRRIVARQRCAARDEPVDPLTVPAPLDRLPWAVAQTEFKVQGADFLAHMGRLLLGAARTSMGGSRPCDYGRIWKSSPETARK
jgi:hypothetical protein